MNTSPIHSGSGIYKITNKINGKCYIGSAINLRLRRNQHVTDLNNKRHVNGKLQNAYEKYGKDSFLFDVLIICSKENLIMYEQRAIDGYDAVKNGYNILPVAGSHLGKKRSKEDIEKQRKTITGRKLSPEHAEKLRNNFKGKSHSDETKEKLRIFHTGLKHTEETKKKIGELSKGRICSEETREKLRISSTGRKMPPRTEEWKINHSLKLTGRKASEETKAKMSIAQKGKKLSEQAKANMRAGWIKRKQRKIEMELLKCL